MSLLLRIVNGMWTKGSMKLKVLVAVSLLVIVPVAVFGGIAYLVAENAVSEEVGKANRETVKQVQERIDEKLITLDKIALQHAFNPNFKEFLSLSNPYENPEKARDVMTVLTSMEGLISDANAVSLYMTQQKLLVSPSQGSRTWGSWTRTFGNGSRRKPRSRRTAGLIS
ncbi:hypothetical protein N6H14_04920 [Paenibacillus sp. CC-CFT747]|nr:hypothetical protein N6H14_04920 [Paenibacillus sp. CC-CFT747]